MTIPSHSTDLRAAADVLRSAQDATGTGANAVPLPLSVVHAFANWLDDAANDAEETGGAADPLALIAGLQVLYSTPTEWPPNSGECLQCDDTGACNGGPCAHPAVGEQDATQPATEAAAAAEFDQGTALLVGEQVVAYAAAVRSEAFRQAAEKIRQEVSDQWDRGNQDWDVHDAADLLRRMADEATP